jgi:hypothetical protein
MLKVVSVECQSPLMLKCTFGTGAVKWLDVAPLLQNHIHLKGIEKLWDSRIFNLARVGEMGEVLWPSIIHTDDPVHGPTVWDYDISPEFIFAEGRSEGLPTEG